MKEVEQWWNVTDREKQIFLGKTYPNATPFITNWKRVASKQTLVFAARGRSLNA
jgi:hypothetical protein